jgi:Fe-S oxidoreductase
MGTLQKLKKYKWLIKTIMHTPGAEKKRLYKGFQDRKKYYTRADIEANLKEMAKCANCPNMCRFDCPALNAAKRETYSPANKARIAYFMGMGRVPMENPSAIKTLYACMGCDACLQWCPMDISTGDLLVEMRHELEKRTLLPDFVTPITEKVSQTGGIFEQPIFTADSEFNIQMPNPQVFYFIGCMSAKHRPQSVRAHIKILQKMGIAFTTAFDNRKCCGSPLYEAGKWNVVTTLAAHNANLINASTAPIVISDCPGCVYMLKESYTKLNSPIKPKVLHSADFFADMLAKKQLIPEKSVSTTITFHDPCVLARKINDCESIRTIFKAIPNLTLKEAYLNKEETQCCGYGSIYHLSNPVYSDDVGKKRLLQLLKHSPDAIVSACPTCEYAIQKAQENGKSPETQVKDFAEILADSL